MGQILAHLVGDYILQPHWMAQAKVRRWPPALLHALLYTLPFLLVTRSAAALAVIGGTHAVIDRYRLARVVAWAKNQAAPRPHRYAWADGRATGYPATTEPFLAVWLLIITDNTMHLLINAAAIRWLG